MTRVVVALLSLALLAAPLVAEAQQAGKVWRIGFIEAGSAPVNQHFLNAFRQGMTDLGYVDGRDFVIEDRWADGRNELFPVCWPSWSSAKWM
jgi:putative ABC transport system substrate-binding protein